MFAFPSYSGLAFALSLCLTASLSPAAYGQSKATTSKANRQLVDEEVNLREAQQLREAYLLLSAANKDYAGHRAKAMSQIERAVHYLDSKVLTKGSNAQKSATVIEDTQATRAAAISKYAPTLKEGQAASDMLLRQAAFLLGQVAVPAQQRSQKTVAKRIAQAQQEIAIALSIR